MTLTRFSAAAVALTIAAGALVGVGGGTGASAAPSLGAACRSGLAIGFQGALSGDSGRYGVAQTRGIALALATFNRAHPSCTVRLVTTDTQGDPARAPRAATTLIGNRSVLAVVGPTFSGEALATGAAYSRSGLTIITPSATNPALSAQRFRTFFRGIANDRAVGSLAARFLTATLKKKRVCIVRDGSDYGAVVAKAVSAKLGKRRACQTTLNSARPNYAAVARTVRAKRADAVFFAGYDAFAAAQVKALRKVKFGKSFVGGDGMLSSLFVTRAGKAGRGAYAVSGTAPVTVSAALAKRYRATYGSAMPAYTAEAYDAANLILAALGRGAATRAAVLSYLRGQRTTGITQTFRFAGNGELVSARAWAYQAGSRRFAVSRRVR